MAEPLSVDLRRRVVDAVGNGMSRRQAAAQFRVGVSSAIRWTSRPRRAATSRPSRWAGIADRGAQAETILSLVAATPGSTLAVFQAALVEKGHRFSVSAIWRFFQRRKITLKKSRRTRPSRKGRNS